MGPSKPDPTDKPGNPDQTASPDTTARAADSNRHPAKAPKIYRDGDYLVVPQRWVELPAGCVVCGAPERGRMRLTIRKASILYAILGLFGAVVYNSSPAARLRAGLCKSHRNEERMARLPTQLLVSGAVASFVAAAWLRTPDALLLLGFASPFLLLQLAMMYAIARPRLLVAMHSDRAYVWLAKVAPSMLAQALPVASATDDAETAAQP